MPNKKPGAGSRPVTLREFQFHEYADFHGRVKGLGRLFFLEGPFACLATAQPEINIHTAATPMTAVAIQPRTMIDRPAVKAPMTDFLETRRTITAGLFKTMTRRNASRGGRVRLKPADRFPPPRPGADGRSR